MSPRDGVRAALIALLVLSLIPAYDRVFATGAWRLPALTAALAALAIAVLVRALGGGAVASAVSTAVGFVVLVPMLTGIVERPTLPGPGLLSLLMATASQGLTELQLTPAPAPLLAGIAVILVAGFWVVPYVAHELLVRWQGPGASLIVMAVLWAAPLIVPMDVPTFRWHTVPFLITAGALLLVTAERSLPRPRLAAAGAVMGAFAIVVASVMPGLLPGFASDGWYGLGRGGAQPRGYQPIVDISQRLQMPQERDVLRVQSSQRSYLRLAGLDSFDGFTWRLGPPGEGSYRPDPASLYSASDLLPPEVPAGRSEPVFVDIEVLDLANIYVPTPYQPVQVLGPFRDDMVWSTEGGFLATWDIDDGRLDDDGPRVGVTQGVTYRVQAERPTPTRDDLVDVEVADDVRERWTQLPREYPELVELAEQIYADAGATTAVDQTLALQEWFTGPGGDFTYDLDVPALRGDDALERFVLDDRVGYCEYFAAAMAVMLRATDIPARVATGFLPGDVVREADPAEGRDLTEYLVTTADAHAWVEVLFPGYGWITFEPTPRSDGAQIQPRADDLTPLETERERAERQPGDSPDGVPSDPSIDNDVLDPDDPAFQGEQPNGDETDAASGAPGEEGGVPWLAVFLVALLLVAAVVALVIADRRRRAYREVAPAARRILVAQARLLEAARLWGLERRPAETILELTRRWHLEGRVDASAVRFARLAQTAAFGGVVDDAMAEEAEGLAARARADLKASIRPGTRRVATIQGPWEDLKLRAQDLVGVNRPR
jgi:transglutaminase-like putative cysteine protease